MGVVLRVNVQHVGTLRKSCYSCGFSSLFLSYQWIYLTVKSCKLPYDLVSGQESYLFCLYMCESLIDWWVSS